MQLTKVAMARDVLHARSVGPYSSVTLQPLAERGQQGGQLMPEAALRALDAAGARSALRESLTIRSDDVGGRIEAYVAMVQGRDPFGWSGPR